MSVLPVDRSTAPIPSALAGPDSPAVTELAKAARHYAEFDPDDPERSKSFKFRVYKHDSIELALRGLFHRKCAYCESSFAATSPVDIEHYRPKAAIVVTEAEVTRTIKPGYWWLAADWENLLPSCIDCNRKRGQDLPEGERAKVGKANAFPLADEGQRATQPGEEAGEVRLLVDPCRDDPASTLRFRPNEATEAVLVSEADGVAGLDRRRADASIRVYGLNREGLRAKRYDRFLQVKHQARALVKATSRFELEPASEAARQDLADELRGLLVFRDAKREYTAMCRQVVDPLVARLRSVLDTKIGTELVVDGVPRDLMDRFLDRYPPTILNVPGGSGAADMAALLGL